MIHFRMRLARAMRGLAFLLPLAVAGCAGMRGQDFPQNYHWHSSEVVYAIIEPGTAIDFATRQPVPSIPLSEQQRRDAIDGLQKWAGIAGPKFREAKPGEEAQVKLVLQTRDQFTGGGDKNGTCQLWTRGPQILGALVRIVAQGDERDERLTWLHEGGHVEGLKHSTNRFTVMYGAPDKYLLGTIEPKSPDAQALRANYANYAEPIPAATTRTQTSDYSVVELD